MAVCEKPEKLVSVDSRLPAGQCPLHLKQLQLHLKQPLLLQLLLLQQEVLEVLELEGFHAPGHHHCTKVCHVTTEHMCTHTHSMARTSAMTGCCAAAAIPVEHHLNHQAMLAGA